MADYIEDYEKKDEPEYDEPEYDEEEYEEEEEEGDGNKKKLFLVIGIVLVFLIGGVAGAYFAGLFDSFLEGGTGDAVGTSDYGTSDGAELFYKDFPEILINLNEKSQKKIGVRIKIVLQLRNGEDLLRIDPFIPKVHKDIQVFIQNQKAVNLKGTEGMQRIREELLTRLNRAFVPSKIKDIYFKEMLVR